ncbi:MAG: 2Fe-2S iron-sulfur cluster-binding protein [Pseudomonadota bacterium]
MAKLIVTDLSGERREIEGETGLSVMENLRDNGIDDIAALCGGSCSCATCHVYVDEAFLDRLPPMEADEDDLLAMAQARKANSRLSCQLEFSASLDGLKVTVAPAD